MRGIAAAIAAVMFAAHATVADAQSAVPNPMKELAECRKVGDDRARLACFDAAAAGIAEATAKNDLIVLDREDVRQTRRGLFGFSFPKLPFFGGGKDAAARETIEPITEIDSIVTGVRGYGYELWRLTLEDGSAWETIEPFAVSVPRNGAKVNIKRNFVGTYFLKIDGGKGVKAIRRR